MKAKKKFGQHFLNDEIAAQNIANLTDNYQNVANILEIGPGKGFLTKYLLEKDKNYQAVEIDRDAVSYLLRNNVLKEDQIIQDDFLRLRLENLFGGEPFLLVGNFPYNISSQIVFKMVENLQQIPAMIGMFQKEMAQRIISTHDCKAYGVISVLVQLYYQGNLEMFLGPNQFTPPPKVDSAVIRLDRIEDDYLSNHRKVRSIVKSAFNNRRKMLRNSLKPFMTSENEELDIWTKRPENLTPQEFVELATIL